jgi:hypothetical protein
MEQPFKRIFKSKHLYNILALTFSLSSNEGIVSSIPAEYRKILLFLIPFFLNVTFKRLIHTVYKKVSPPPPQKKSHDFSTIFKKQNSVQMLKVILWGTVFVNLSFFRKILPKF